MQVGDFVSRVRVNLLSYTGLLQGSERIYGGQDMDWPVCCGVSEAQSILTGALGPLE